MSCEPSVKRRWKSSRLQGLPTVGRRSPPVQRAVPVGGPHHDAAPPARADSRRPQTRTRCRTMPSNLRSSTPSPIPRICSSRPVSPRWPSQSLRRTRPSTTRNRPWARSRFRRAACNQSTARRLRSAPARASFARMRPALSSDDRGAVRPCRLANAQRCSIRQPARSAAIRWSLRRTTTSRRREQSGCFRRGAADAASRRACGASTAWGRSGLSARMGTRWERRRSCPSLPVGPP